MAPTPSPAQQKLLDRIQAGGQLALDPKTGRYSLAESGRLKQVDQRPVLVMIRDGLLVQDITGRLWLPDSAAITA